MSTPPSPVDLGDLFGGLFGTVNKRVLPLEVLRGYRDSPREERPIELRRRARCFPCKGEGCKECSFVGWRVRTESVIVPIPPGSHVGSTIHVPQKSDSPLVSGIPGFLTGQQSELHVELVEPGERADELLAAQRAHEADMERAWEETRAKKVVERKGERRAIFVSLGAALSLGAICGGIFLTHYCGLSKTGERCTNDGDCRARQCLVLTRSDDFLMAHEEGRVCTNTCDTNADCPSTMTCGAIARTSIPMLASHRIDGLACVPNVPSSAR